MAIQINKNQREITLSVSDLASELRAGSSSGAAATTSRLTAGRRAHDVYQKQQARTRENYQREVTVDFRREIEDFTFIVQGRIDGVYEENDHTIIEEVKTVILAPPHFAKIDATALPHYVNQLKIYCYLVALSREKSVQGLLILVNLVDQVRRTLEIPIDLTQIGDFIEQRLWQILRRIRETETRQAQRHEMLPQLNFPHATVRQFQEDVVQDIQQALASGNDLLISAPAGIGKTAAALYATLKFALEKDKLLFYVTSKTTQQQIVQETLATFNQQSGVTLRAITIQAKEKICPQDVCLCHEEFCPLIENYYGRLETSGVIQEMLQLGQITPAQVRESGLRHQLCPFELSLDLSLQMDLIVADYNYVFDPQAYLRRFFGEGKYDHFILIVDEAHNLYNRGRDYYSATLFCDDLQSLIFECQQQAPLIYSRLKSVYLELDAIFREVAGQLRSRAPKVLFEPDKPRFKRAKDTLNDYMLDYFIFKKLHSRLAPDDPFDNFYFQFTRFAGILELEGDEFAYIYDQSRENTGLSVLCKDPAAQLKQRIDGFYATLAMSATFEPLPFYQNVLGFAPDVPRRSYPSPFPAANRKILVAPHISTRYQERDQAYGPVAELIQEIAQLKPGNYFAFFPSFQFLERVADLIYLPEFLVIRQTGFMKEKERQRVIDQLRKSDENCLVLAVQGGIFAEGVDYPGSMLIGAFIVSPALPAFTFEQELMKQYYAEHYGQGFEYAYLYPGMNRVIQSAGRVIRTHTDKGIIVLVDQRFATAYYNSVFPAYWYQDSPSELISRDLKAEVKQFWRDCER